MSKKKEKKNPVGHILPDGSGCFKATVPTIKEKKKERKEIGDGYIGGYPDYYSYYGSPEYVKMLKQREEARKKSKKIYGKITAIDVEIELKNAEIFKIKSAISVLNSKKVQLKSDAIEVLERCDLD